MDKIRGWAKIWEGTRMGFASAQPTWMRGRPRSGKEPITYSSSILD